MKNPYTNTNLLNCLTCGEPSIFSQGESNHPLCTNCWEVERRIETYLTNQNGIYFIDEKLKEAKLNHF